MEENLSRNGLNPFGIKEHDSEFEGALTGLKLAILAIAVPLVAVFLNFASILDQAIVSTLVKWIG